MERYDADSVDPAGVQSLHPPSMLTWHYMKESDALRDSKGAPDDLSVADLH